jgi:hypothetical protein
MPPTHVECCNELFTLEEAIGHVATRSNRCEWTYELLAAMLAAQTAHPSHADGTRISTTVLTAKCLRRIALERTHNFSVVPADLWAMFRGTQFHAQLEQWAHPDSYGEARFYVDDIGVQIPAIKEALPDEDRSFSGSPDLVDPGKGVVFDYKRTKEVPRFGNVWPDHVAQLNINRWLADKADRVTLQEPAFPYIEARDRRSVEFGDLSEWPGLLDLELADEAHVNATWDLHVPEVRARFSAKEWLELVIVYVDDKGPKPLVVKESKDVPAKNGGTKRRRFPQVWSDDQVEAYIAEKYIAARQALNAGIAPIPPGFEHQTHILCQYCNVRKECARYEKEGK